MFCSTIIATIGRPSLSRAVCSVLDQSFTDAGFEVIVVNDSGRPLPEAAWQQSERVRVVTTNRRERAVARNTGAAMARGDYLHFLDDDDWLAPDALAHFWKNQPGEDAGWLYGVSQLVDRQGRPLIRLHHELSGNCFLQVMAGEWVPLQSSLVAAEAFFAVGAFNPLLAGPEDIDLLRRVALAYPLAGMDQLAAFIERGDEGSSTDYDRHPGLSRRAREEILEEPGVFSRLRPAMTGPYWSGRLVRLYLTSALWNARRLRALTTVSRLSYAFRGLLLGGSDALSADFWRSLARPYASPTFARGFALAASGNAQQAGPAATTGSVES